VRDASGAVVWQHDPAQVLRTASVGKILLLLETARQLAGGALDPGILLSRGDDPVGDSGIWHVLRTGLLPLHDVAALVGALSDNLATNVLLRHVGLASVDALRRSVGLRDTRLLDEVRRLVHRMERGPEPAPGSEQVVRWLSGNTDLSMVAGAFDLDPLAHRTADRPRIRLWNKTGTDDGVRADVGHVSRAGTAYSFAVLANWDSDLAEHGTDVGAAMGGVGASLALLLG